MNLYSDYCFCSNRILIGTPFERKYISLSSGIFIIMLLSSQVFKDQNFEVSKTMMNLNNK